MVNAAIYVCDISGARDTSQKVTGDFFINRVPKSEKNTALCLHRLMRNSDSINVLKILNL